MICIGDESLPKCILICTHRTTKVSLLKVKELPHTDFDKSFRNLHGHLTMRSYDQVSPNEVLMLRRM